VLTGTDLLRQFLTVRTEVIGPVLTKIWDTPESTRTERMKHVIEPTFAVDYTTEFANQLGVPNTNDAADRIVGGAARVTYGVTNRLFYRGRPTESAKGLTREFVTVGVQQSYYTDPLASLYDTNYVSGHPKTGVAVADRRHRPLLADARLRHQRARGIRRQRLRPPDAVRRGVVNGLRGVWQCHVQPQPQCGRSRIRTAFSPDPRA
jgi:hypothetical protein